MPWGGSVGTPRTQSGVPHWLFQSSAGPGTPRGCMGRPSMLSGRRSARESGGEAGNGCAGTKAGGCTRGGCRREVGVAKPRDPLPGRRSGLSECCSTRGRPGRGAGGSRRRKLRVERRGRGSPRPTLRERWPAAELPGVPVPSGCVAAGSMPTKAERWKLGLEDWGGPSRCSTSTEPWLALAGAPLPSCNAVPRGPPPDSDSIPAPRTAHEPPANGEERMGYQSAALGRQGWLAGEGECCPGRRGLMFAPTRPGARLQRDGRRPPGSSPGASWQTWPASGSECPCCHSSRKPSGTLGRGRTGLPHL